MAFIHLLVIKTSDPKLLSKDYELLGFVFEEHRHGHGPIHYAAENDGFVFEIYPLPKHQTLADQSTRLGVSVENLDQTLQQLLGSRWMLLSPAAPTEFGYVAVVQDADGRKIELKQLEPAF